ncbi:hypothetical protein LV92_01960 [Arenibacter echinorum]|uniref:Uncharacterized protein n=1 Tax=Arenibacter echinorum TaxID=440515 RepID=A0A327RAT9_9FLAO|nr:hypothetical protein LV92_01960 [Arenibacter echinorum]
MYGIELIITCFIKVNLEKTEIMFFDKETSSKELPEKNKWLLWLRYFESSSNSYIKG